MPSFREERYGLLHKILNNWPNEPERPPLLLNGLMENDSPKVIEEIIKLFFNKPVSPGHPDVLILEKDPRKSNIDVDRTREFIAQLALSRFELPHKLGIIPAAHLLNPASQNALLKTLEEPLPKRYLILGTTAKNLLLPTILSRSTVINLPQPALEIDGDLTNRYQKWTRLDPANRLKESGLWSEGKPENIIQFFDFILNKLRQELIDDLNQNNIKKARQICGQLARALDYSEQLQRTSGANPKLLFESYLLNIG